MFEPPRCPNQACPMHASPTPKFFIRRGYYRAERTMGLDSGCVYGGTLTAWCQDEDRIVQIPAISRPS